MVKTAKHLLFLIFILASTGNVVAGDEDIELYVIGFDIAPGSDEESKLMEMAQEMSGEYITAENAEQLEDALKKSYMDPDEMIISLIKEYLTGYSDLILVDYGIEGKNEAVVTLNLLDQKTDDEITTDAFVTIMAMPLGYPMADVYVVKTFSEFANYTFMINSNDLKNANSPEELQSAMYIHKGEKGEKGVYGLILILLAALILIGLYYKLKKGRS